jgi:hypothetical protein
VPGCCSDATVIRFLSKRIVSAVGAFFWVRSVLVGWVGSGLRRGGSDLPSLSS